MLTLIKRIFLSQQRRPRSWQNHRENWRWKGENDSGKIWSSWNDCSPWGEGACSWRGTALLEAMDSIFGTSTPDAVFAFCSGIATRTGKMETVASLQEASGIRWCVIHGWSFPADTGLGSATVLCWASLGSWETKESVCTLLATCLQLSTPTPGGQYVVPQRYL